MERRESEPQGFGICYRLFNFLAENLFVRGLKRVTLGQPISHGPPVGASVPQSKVVSAADQPFEGKRVHTMVNRLSKISADSLIKIEFEQSNGFSVRDLASSTHGTEHIQDDEGVHTQSFQIKKIPVEGFKSDSEISLDIHKDRGKGLLIPSGTEDRGASAPMTVPTTSDDDSTDRNMQKKVRRRKSPMEKKLTLAIEPEKDVKVRAQTPVIPLLSSAFNIDKRSDELIRRTREALRSSASVET